MIIISIFSSYVLNIHCKLQHTCNKINKLFSVKTSLADYCLCFHCGIVGPGLNFTEKSEMHLSKCGFNYDNAFTCK